ncbi:hypothetical protein F4604DRAFT_1196032 [Suillus subluteus]|nr:hypothetical protein F4604DRAFT_1196032 [Suillus subluteus]
MTEPWAFQGGTPLSDTPESDLASLSPRTALLSPPYENAELTRLRRVHGSPNDKFRRERERVHATASARDLLRLLVNEEYEAKQTRKVLYTALDRLDAESRRAEEAEVQLAETLERTRSINEARVTAQQEAARAQEELRLYKLQLDNAQREILRAQDVLGVIEAQRDDAEAAAADARSKARRLNEERLIELAREEGRRFGYEEGIRRGRNMGYREGRVTGTDGGRRDAAADRLLDIHEEANNASVVLPPQPAPVTPMPESRNAPEVLRVSSHISTSVNGRRDSRSRRDSESDSASRTSIPRAPDPIVMPVMVEHPRSRTDTSVTSQSSRSRSHPQPWPMSERSSTRSPSTKPVSVQNSAPSVQHSEFQVPPDGYVPTLGKDNRIPLPPPHELSRSISSPSPSQPVAGPSSDSVRTFDYPPRRASPESQASTKMSMSQSSTISALDIVGLPNMTSRDKRRERNGLSIIHEDASVTADYETVTGSDAGHHHHRSERRSERDADSEATRHSRREISKQRLADELSRSNSSESDWRRYGTEDKTHMQSSDSATHPRLSNMATPNPLSPSNWDDANTPRHNRHSRTVSTPSQRESARYEHRRDVSSDSSVPEITIQPPSCPPSDAPSRRASVFGLLSPDHANHPLPVPVPVSQRTSPVPTVPNTPVSAPISLVGSMYDRGQLPTSFTGNSGAPPPGGPVIPHMTGREAPSQRSSLYAHAQPESRRSQTPQSYVASPVPSGFSYPAPPIAREPTPNGSGQRGDRSSTHERRQSLSQTAGMTPGAPPRSLQPGRGETSRSSHKQRSNASSSSRQSFAHYDPGVYNDPAYLSSNESVLLDPRTGANTAANSGGSRRTS